MENKEVELALLLMFDNVREKLEEIPEDITNPQLTLNELHILEKTDFNIVYRLLSGNQYFLVIHNNGAIDRFPVNGNRFRGLELGVVYTKEELMLRAVKEHSAKPVVDVEISVEDFLKFIKRTNPRQIEYSKKED